MRPDQDHARLIDAPDAPGGLRLALRAARDAGPDATELQLLAARVHRAVRVAPLPAVPATRTPSLAKVTAVIALAACGALLGRVLRSDEPKAPPEPVASDVALLATGSESPASAAAPGEPVPDPPTPLPLPTVPSTIRGPARATTATTALAPPPKVRDAQDPNTSVVDSSGEARLLTRARAELKDDPSGALALADEHAQRYAKGQLVEEREVIAMTALVRLGRREEATARWGVFRVRFERSAYAPRLFALFAPFENSTEKNAALPPLTP